MDSQNGHHPKEHESGRTNAYADAAMVDRPQEIVDFERATDPYANMLPGISNIRAAQTIGRGMEVGKRGNRLVLAISVFMLLALLLPLVFAVINQVINH